MVTTKMRELSDGGYESPYFESYDKSGDSYGLAWRYLGVYLGSDGYTRKVLWAAYYDPSYAGNQIGEYQYYDWANSKWDNSTCTNGGRCRKMDCHASSSYTWKLVGVYTESLEFDNDTFFEQLFKHQGLCLWGGYNSDYKFMQTMREEMATYATCEYVKYGVYVGAKPTKGGDLSFAVYKDSSCKRERSGSSYSVNSYITSSSGYTWSKAVDKWNNLMKAYKTCQPCRAYSRTANSQRRHLVEYNDGAGEDEINGFNCYDAAGYQNCNQCYKFDTHTDMAEASTSDLKLATKQGTILSITVNGISYGGSQSSSSTYNGSSSTSSAYSVSSMAVGLAVLAIGGLFARFHCKRRIITTTEGDLPLDQPVLKD